MGLADGRSACGGQEKTDSDSPPNVLAQGGNDAGGGGNSTPSGCKLLFEVNYEAGTRGPDGGDVEHWRELMNIIIVARKAWTWVTAAGTLKRGRQPVYRHALAGRKLGNLSFEDAEG